MFRGYHVISSLKPGYYQLWSLDQGARIIVHQTAHVAVVIVAFGNGRTGWRTEAIPERTPRFPQVNTIYSAVYFLTKDTHSSPVRARYGCISWVLSLTECLPSNSLCGVQYSVILYRDISSAYSTVLIVACQDVKVTPPVTLWCSDIIIA